MTSQVNSQLLGKTNQGTGFFYSEMEPQAPNKNWYKIENTWLITNRHVVLFKDELGHEHLPEVFTFFLRRYEKDTFTWEPVVISGADVFARLKIFKDSSIDLVGIKVLDLLNEKARTVSHLVQWASVSDREFPGRDSLFHHVGDDVLTVGYPSGYYDAVNLLPIAKAGVIATWWGAGFNGHPYFLIDSKLLPGSSGSIVISKPTNFTMIGGNPAYSKVKLFSFLGIFSAEPYRTDSDIFDMGDFLIQKKERYDLGVVWYYYLVPELIKNGVSFN